MYVVISVIIIITIMIIILLPYFYCYYYFSANILGLYSAYVHGFFRSFWEICRLCFPSKSITITKHVPPKYHKNLIILYDILNQTRIIWAKAAW